MSAGVVAACDVAEQDGEGEKGGMLNVLFAAAAFDMRKRTRGLDQPQPCFMLMYALEH